MSACLYLFKTIELTWSWKSVVFPWHWFKLFLVPCCSHQVMWSWIGQPKSKWLAGLPATCQPRVQPVNDHCCVVDILALSMSVSIYVSVCNSLCVCRSDVWSDWQLCCWFHHTELCGTHCTLTCCRYLHRWSSYEENEKINDSRHPITASRHKMLTS